MGGFCKTSRKFTIDCVALDDALGETSRHANGQSNSGYEMSYHSTLPPVDGDIEERVLQSFSHPRQKILDGPSAEQHINGGIPHLSRVPSHKSKSTKSRQVAAVTKASEVSSLLGRAGTVGLGKAVEVLGTLGSSVTNLSLKNGFTSGATTKGIKISILAFEVANTIVRGANLMQSLSNESIRHLKDVLLPSVAVQNLISRDKEELLRIATEDKREELKIFSGEVVRFGNRCKGPQWHNLDRYFEKFGSERAPQKLSKEDAEKVMQQLMELAQHTVELYHELHALDMFDQDYQHGFKKGTIIVAHKKENSVNCAGKSLANFREELKSQKKHVRNLKKKSLWSKNLEEVMDKLVDIVHFLRLTMHEAFGTADTEGKVKDYEDNHKKLGSAGLSLHYANIISQIDTLASCSTSVPRNLRDALYQGLPLNIKSALRRRLQSFQAKEELTVPQIKAEMKKTLQWLVPIAANTTKAHHGFGWVGDWANTGPAGQTYMLQIETLHHANKMKTEAYILELVVWLHLLVSKEAAIGNVGMRSSMKSLIPSPSQNQKTTEQLFSPKAYYTTELTVEDQEMLQDISKRKLTPGISNSQEFDTAKTRLLRKNHRLCKSRSHSPSSESENNSFFIRRLSSVHVINFASDRIKALDMIDRVDTI